MSDRAPRLYGHLYDPPGEERGLEIDHLVGVAPSKRDSFDLSDRVPEIIDQFGNSCEGAATWMLIMLAAYAAGVTLDPSYQAPYTGGRGLANLGADVLQDDGAYPNKVYAYLDEWGIVSRGRWPDDVDLTAPLPIDVLQAGSLASVKGGVFRIYETKPEEIFARIEQTIDAGYGVTGGMSVDKTYEDGPGGLYGPPYGPSLGAHCQCLVGYQRRQPGRPGQYKVRNSWGPRWNDNGHAWLHEDVIINLWRDMTTLRISPKRLVPRMPTSRAA